MRCVRSALRAADRNQRDEPDANWARRLKRVLGAGRDVRLVGLPGAAAERLRLMCGELAAG
jgi:hypothetical protein